MSGSACKTYFSITGVFDFYKVAAALGLKDCTGWDKSEINGEGKPYGFSYLETCVCKDYDVYIYRMLEKSIEPLLSKIGLLKELKQKYGLEYSLCALPEIEFFRYGEGEKYSTVTPCLSPSLKVMGFCVEIGAELDIDYSIIGK